MIKPVATINVVPNLPEPLQALHKLAYNLRWTWDNETTTLWRRLDNDLWDKTGHNPVWMLGLISQERLETLQKDPAFMAHLNRADANFEAYMSAEDTWYRQQYGHLKTRPVIAYFSMEFGLTECVQNYSGGLGVLSGDHLKSASDLDLPLIGLGEAEYQGRVLPGADALRAAGLQPVVLAAKEGLALTNGTAVMCAVGVLETLRAEQISHTADVAACLSLEALNGTLTAFDARIQQLRPFPRQLACAENLRRLLAGSDLVRTPTATNVQDAYTLRCIPQVHGAARDAIAYARWVFEIELNSVTDNPLIF